VPCNLSVRREVTISAVKGALNERVGIFIVKVHLHAVKTDKSFLNSVDAGKSNSRIVLNRGRPRARSSHRLRAEIPTYEGSTKTAISRVIGRI